MRAFLSILAHVAHLACSFSPILNRMNKLMFWFKHANTKKHVSKPSWLSGWVILNILAHLAHLAQSYFSLIFSATNKWNCFKFDLTNKKSCNDWRQEHGEKWTLWLFWVFSSRRQPPLLVNTRFLVFQLKRDNSRVTDQPTYSQSLKVACLQLKKEIVFFFFL